MNKTRDCVLSENARITKSFLGRLRGLLFTEKSDLVLESPRETIEHSSIHMFFMGYAIDVVWVDKQGTVVGVLKGVPPSSLLKPGTFLIYRPPKPSKYVVELGKGSLHDTEIGDLIEFI
ncbi:MAG: DUF192 domain-containing protein [Methanobacteriota archaeon]